MASDPITSWQIDGDKVEAVTEFIFLGFKITVYDDCSQKIKKMRCSWKKTYDKPRQYIKQQKHHFVNKGLYRQSYGFSNSHAWM